MATGAVLPSMRKQLTNFWRCPHRVSFSPSGQTNCPVGAGTASDSAARDIALITLNHWIVELCFYALFATALGSGPARRRYLSLKPVFDRIAATLLGALGLRLLLEK